MFHKGCVPTSELFTMTGCASSNCPVRLSALMMSSCKAPDGEQS